MHKQSTSSASLSTDEKLDAIIMYLRRMDRRDKWRTVGGFFRTLISLIPIILFVWGSYYFYEHSDEFIKKVTKEAAAQAQSMTNTDGFMKQFEKYLPQKK